MLRFKFIEKWQKGFLRFCKGDSAFTKSISNQQGDQRSLRNLDEMNKIRDPDDIQSDVCQDESSLSNVADDKNQTPQQEEQIYNDEQQINKTFPKIGIPFMVTRLMKQDLSDLGYTKDQIQLMTPAQAVYIIDKQLTKF